MQALEIDLPGTTTRSSDHASNRTFRRYSLSMCLFQGSIIVVLFYLLLVPGRIPRFFQVTDPTNVPRDNILLYTSHEKVFKVVVGPIEGCIQRRHDIQQSVICNSSHIELCRPVELAVSNRAPLTTTSNGHGLPAIKITTSKAGSRLNSESIRLPRSTCRFDGKVYCRFETTLVIMPNITRQTILGWGGAMTDSSVNTILSLTTNGTRRLLDDYFGQDGLRFNMVRITIGGSDFSSRFYTNDDSVKDDLKLENFKLKEEDLLYKIPLIKLIQDEYNLPDRGAIKLFASMWSPPTWMKTNNHFNKGYLKGNISGNTSDRDNLSEAYYDALSELKIKFIESYQRNAIKFWGLTVMNEPIFAVQPFLDFNTMIFPRDDYGNYVKKYLGPKIRASPDLKHLKLMIHDDNRRFLEKFTLPLIPKLDAYIDGVSVHGYIDEAYELMDVVYDAMGKGDRFVMPTELCSGHLPFMEKALIGNWNRGIHYALDIIHSLQHSAAGWVDWNMVLDTTGGPGWLGGRLDAPVIVDKGQDLYHKSPMFFVLGQFSRYIPPGSLAVKSRLLNGNYDNHFETVTFKLATENNKFATVVVNNNPYPIDLNLRLQDSTSMYRLVCDPDSVTTLIYPQF